MRNMKDDRREESFGRRARDEGRTQQEKKTEGAMVQVPCDSLNKPHSKAQSSACVDHSCRLI